MASLRRTAFSATLWGAGEVAARYGIQFVVMAALARLVGPKEFGLIALVAAFTAIGVIFVNGGFGTALIQKPDADADDEATAFYANLAISVAATILLVLAAPAIARFFAEPAIAGATVAMSLILPLSAAASVPDAILIKRLQFKTRVRIEVGTSLTSGAIAVGLAFHGYGMWSLVFQSIASIGSRSLLLWLLSGWRPAGRFSWARLRSLWAFGMFALAANMLDTLFNRSQLLLIGKLHTSQDLGHYSMAQNTQQVPVTLVSATLSRVGLPILAATGSDIRRHGDATRRAMATSTFLAIPLAALLSASALPLVALVLGKGWSGAGIYFSILSVALAFIPSQTLALVAMNAAGQPGTAFKSELCRKIGAIALIVIASPHGLRAIAVASVAGSALGTVVTGFFLARITDYPLARQMRDIGASLAAATTAAAAAAIVGRLLAASNGLVALACQALVFLVGYAALALAMNRHLASEARAAFRRA